ncbi:Rac GTPase-activating protein 1 [Acipenser ruthenus]|uniref:Rac GTPase-activating protein 1 n=1 Tax=Acipenser ruthenus TaxID=7906 RepID=A0A444UTU3_ACIRT|nr:Rac GTPase-activating protein 1 [Acipenser ruthenus]
MNVWIAVALGLTILFLQEMETAVLQMHNLFDQLLRQVEVLNEGMEPQFLQLARDFEECRRRWQKTDAELLRCKEILSKAETERSALDVKLKHARNQVDVEIKRRQRAETDYEKLERQIQLIRELLIAEGSTSIQLSDEQRSALAFLNARSQPTGLNASKRLSTIDESASMMSDISYDKTDDSLDWDSSIVKTVRLKKREKRLARDFEECRRRWQKTDAELLRCKEILSKAETERSALDVKLKHARNQVDVEIKRRQRAETDYEKLERQIQLIRELLIAEGSTSIQLSDEQRSALAFLNARSQPTGLNASKRLSTIDESASMMSDISYDKTDDSLDWDSSIVKTVRLKKREKRGNESIVTKTTVTVPSDGGPIEAVSTIETVPYWTRSRRKTANLQGWDSDSILSENVDAENVGLQKKPEVIKPESCVPCGKRIKFGKLALKCRDCRVVAHPECRDRCPLPCIPSLTGTPVRNGETGLYRVSGCDRTVKELKEKFLRGKTVPLLSKVDDVHAICSLLKDFLRNLKEPLLTSRLNRPFMDAAGTRSLNAFTPVSIRNLFLIDFLNFRRENQEA